ncbi:DUF4197 domain-containing protein [Owenweeksia hongkongensis]|uniref:DUF4197 domain-containing protein n=1 Tax=Owenweeksia hongkongensis TaxID=253245 RepID=UPI003A9042A8
MIKFARLAAIAAISFSFASCETADAVKDILDTSLTDEEIVDGLKSALAVGTDTSTAQLGTEDGYYADLAVKLLLPTEVQTSIETFKSKSINLGLVTITGEDLYDGYTNSTLGINIPGLKSKEDELIKGINRAAESAASTAGPIFIDAITDITIEDGYDILFGGDSTAATTYLQGRTQVTLFNNFEPKIDAALQAVKVGNSSVVDEYEDFITQYNAVLNTSVGIGTIGSLMGINAIATTDLSAYSTEKGLDGLFLKISEEEADIRSNPLARVNAILQKVFGQLD